MQLTDLLTTCLRQGAVPFAYPITSDTRLPIFQHVTLKTWVGPGYEPGWLWISLLECVSISAQDSSKTLLRGVSNTAIREKFNETS